MANTPWAALEQRRALLDQVHENTARLAYHYATLTTTGFGMMKIPEAVMFDCTFVEKPYITTGCYVNDEILEDHQFPQVTSGGYKWVQDDSLFYTGCHVWFNVQGGTATLEIFHNLTFTGIAYKSLPTELLDW